MHNVYRLSEINILSIRMAGRDMPTVIHEKLVNKSLSAPNQ